jgi:hypothetical protein
MDAASTLQFKVLDCIYSFLKNTKLNSTANTVLASFTGGDLGRRMSITLVCNETAGVST